MICNKVGLWGPTYIKTEIVLKFKLKTLYSGTWKYVTNKNIIHNFESKSHIEYINVKKKVLQLTWTAQELLQIIVMEPNVEV